MKIEARYKPELACAADDSRPLFQCVLVERLKGRRGIAVAADGFILAVVR